jgi:hypothetical protein
MTPILGITASQITGHLWSPGKDYDSIATTTVSTAVSSITFSSIPTTYRHLQIRAIAKNGTSSSNVIMYFNGDSVTTNYRSHYMEGTGSAVSSGSVTSYNGIFCFGSSQPTSIVGAGVIDILDYSSSVKNKVTRVLGGADENGTGVIDFTSGIWVNTSSITSITFSVYSSFQSGTQFALYGVK